jgi:stearoyl-CoA desaturase (delta-9 desaturase)
MYLLSCLLVFFVAYLVNTTMISVFYHRGLAHGSVRLSPAAERFVGRVGIWTTGIDPKAWVCMHRRHHDFSDLPEDPHSPVHYGFFGLAIAQLRNYERTLIKLMRRDEEYCRTVADLDFAISLPNRSGYWYAPYVAHIAVALLIAVPSGWWALGVCYWLGIMSHPLEGWLVNALGHAVGSRNLETPDNSRNNHIAAWLVVGEGFQNNHHRFPGSAKFSFRRKEIDPGYWICLALEKIRVLQIERDGLIPTPSAYAWIEAKTL